VIFSNPLAKSDKEIRLERLRVLNVSAISFESFGNLSADSLIKLYADNCSLISLEPLIRFSTVKHLTVNENRLATVQGIEKLTRLKTLEADENLIEDASDLRALKNLERLSIRDNLITDMSPLFELEELKDLFISGNPIRSRKGFDRNRFRKFDFES